MMENALWMPRPSLAWSLLVVAGVLEVVWLVALKRSESFAQPAYGAISVVVAWLSFALLAVTMRAIPAGTAYAVWTGVGAAGGALAGILLFGESMNAVRLVSVGLIILGIAGVKLTQ
jgi:quaternary ammonium compound-resistance protein SugE